MRERDATGYSHHLTCGTGMDKSQNGSNMVERKSQTVHVMELFSCPTNRSGGGDDRGKVTLDSTSAHGNVRQSASARRSLTHDFAVLPVQVHVPHSPGFFVIPRGDSMRM